MTTLDILHVLKTTIIPACCAGVVVSFVLSIVYRQLESLYRQSYPYGERLSDTEDKQFLELP
uniref:hypothetical protein n=1 Tax=uncultured Allobacillus sp. TaxID=1638025 RepID=UPI0025942940|nr:hypothetical protein [uncultured Allobacillus sp.]